MPGLAAHTAPRGWGRAMAVRVYGVGTAGCWHTVKRGQGAKCRSCYSETDALTHTLELWLPGLKN